MKLSSGWLREFVDLTVDDRRLAEDLTSIGIAVEGIFGEGANTVFEMEIGTNRPDAMNHYGVAREAGARYGLPLRLGPIHGADDSCRNDQKLARENRQPPGSRGSAPHQRRRRRVELHALG